MSESGAVQPVRDKNVTPGPRAGPAAAGALDQTLQAPAITLQSTDRIPAAIGNDKRARE